MIIKMIMKKTGQFYDSSGIISNECSLKFIWQEAREEWEDVWMQLTLKELVARAALARRTG